jgi:4-hydroxy-3-methylbut-2-enyl diphosphate reductase
MEVLLAEHMGMCFGVRDAIDLALRLTRQGPLTILGELVHNPEVVARIDAAGAVRARQPEEVLTPAVLVTAHGTSQAVLDRLQSKGLQVHDAACPLVRRVHRALKSLVRQGYHPVIIGQADHVEVRGLTDDLDNFTVLLHEEDIEILQGWPRLGIVAQTTQPLARVQGLVQAIRRRFPEATVRFIDTVCKPTKDRQTAMNRLVAESEVVVVVGGPDSNNSRKLAEYARSRGRPAYQVANVDGLRPEWFYGVGVVGLTAGTSTPDELISEVRAWLENH